MRTPYFYFLLLLGIGFSSYAQSTISDAERERLMQLDFEAFDQDMQGGWRTYADQMQLELAADLIVEYLQRHGELEPGERTVMNFHAGQMYAILGKGEQAIPYFERSKKGDDVMNWNEYVDATIAFLKKDREAFDENIKVVETASPFPPASNKNLILLQKLGANFDKSYGQALGIQ